MYSTSINVLFGLFSMCIHLLFFFLHVSRSRNDIKKQNFNLFVFCILFVALSLTLSSHLYEKARNFAIIYTPFEKTDTEDSGSSLSDVSSSDNDFAKIQFEFSSPEEE